MNGIKYLLDTNFILGLLKSDYATMERLALAPVKIYQCAYSSITRMKLLGYHGMTSAEETIIRHKLMQLHYLPITTDVEDRAIQLRRSYRIKLPDAIIAATALVFDAELLTHDKMLLTTMSLATDSKIS